MSLNTAADLKSVAKSEERKDFCQDALNDTRTLLSGWDHNVNGPKLLCPSLASLSQRYFLNNTASSKSTQAINNIKKKSSSNHTISNSSVNSQNRIENSLPSIHTRFTSDLFPFSEQSASPQHLNQAIALQDSVQRLESALYANKSTAGSPEVGNGACSSSCSASNPIADAEYHIITSLTSILLDNNNNIHDNNGNKEGFYSTSNEALNSILSLFSTTPRRVCQHPFRKNDIVWVCRTCQSDETCVLCHECFSRSDHTGHDVAFYHAQAGGCCDCGDPDAWDPKGFCDRHGHNYKKNHEEYGINTSLGNEINIKDVEERARGMVEAIGDWLVQEILTNVEKGWKRTITSPSNLSASSKTGDSKTQNATFELGMDGLTQHGIYLTLHLDDIHTPKELTTVLSHLFQSRNPNSPILNKIVRLLKQSQGNLILWGTYELLTEVGSVVSSLWKDNDKHATARIASLMQEKAHIFKKEGFHVSIQTHFELQMEQRAIAVLHWLSILARSCDSLCEVVAHSLSQRHLIPLLEADLKLPRKITSSWHALLLTLLAIPQFKQDLAAAYCDSYGRVTKEYAEGVGVLDCSCFTLSVQFLNREKYVKELVKERNLLERLTKSLLETLRLAKQRILHDMKNIELESNGNDILAQNNYHFSTTTSVFMEQSTLYGLNGEEYILHSNATLDPTHPVLSHRRYSPCISDLKCVLNVVGMAREFAAGGKCLDDWLELLSIPQGMDGQTWRTRAQGHIHVEPKGWIGAFNASISLGSLFERILGWEDNDLSPIYESKENSLLTAIEVTVKTLTFVSKWQKKEFPIPSTINTSRLKARETRILPYSTVSIKHATPSIFSALYLPQSYPWSFHYPLHRFAASCLRECARRETQGMVELEHLLTTSRPESDFRALLEGMIEISLLVLSRAAQIRAGIWKRNGQGMHDQVLNYAEPPFCRLLRDADVTVLQFAIAALMKLQPWGGVAYFTNLSVHRFGVFDFCGFDKNKNVMEKDADQPSLSSDDNEEYATSTMEDISDQDSNDIRDNETQVLNSPAEYDSVVSLLLVEELLHLWILLLTEIPPSPTSSSPEKIIKLAKSRMRREIIHRLASGPKTHSELAEVQHVLPLRDTIALNAEGRILNPDDATGAALECILSLVGKQSNASNCGPNKWELNKDAWVDYDPAFWHIAQRAHQTIAEVKTITGPKSSPRSYAPKPADFHAWYGNIRFGLIGDAAILSVCYRVLHVHCSDTAKSRNVGPLRGKSAYEQEAFSEIALSRTVHLLTLAAFVCEDGSNVNDISMDCLAGSIFKSNDELRSGVWVEKYLLAKPEAIMDSLWYEGEDCALLLLHKLAMEGSGRDGSFTAQDSSLRDGAKWLCDYAVNHSSKADALLSKSKQDEKDKRAKSAISLEQRKQEARMRAMQKMTMMTNKFLDVMQEVDADHGDNSMETELTTNANSASAEGEKSENDFNEMDVSSSSSLDNSGRSSNNSHLTRYLSLLNERPLCSICGDNDNTDDENSKVNLLKNVTNNALAFCGHAQASTILKGGGGPPDGEYIGRFVGTHVALCGHAMHISCCDSYLASVASRDSGVSGNDRIEGGKKGEFLCPVCQRLSNCLVPFIDVGMDWIECPSKPAYSDVDNMECDTDDSYSIAPLHTFLNETLWFKEHILQSKDMLNESIPISGSSPNNTPSSQSPNQSSTIASCHKSRRSLFAAWNYVMRAPTFRRRKSIIGQKLPSPQTTTASRSKQNKNRSRSISKESSSGVTEVWRRLMDQLSDVSHRADWKRLGEDNLSNNYGEFRHYHVEKVAYNAARRENEKIDWPLCLFPTSMTESQRNELSREKLISKLLLSIQSFTYSVCAEAADVRHRLKKGYKASTMYGVHSFSINGELVLMPMADGAATFDGRLGKLRYFALSIMTACSALAHEIINLVLPINHSTMALHNDSDNPVRAPIAHLLLHGHILTHVVAAMCSTCGRGRVKSNAIGASLIGCSDDFYDEDSEWNNFRESDGNPSLALSVVQDCENFIKMGMVARVLQALLGHLNFGFFSDSDQVFIEMLKSPIVELASNTPRQGKGWENDQWKIGCFELLKAAITSMSEKLNDINTTSFSEKDVWDKFSAACAHAKDVTTSFLSDSALFLQLLIPGVVKESRNLADNESISSLEQLASWLRIESLPEIMKSSVVQRIVSNWYQHAIPLNPLLKSKSDEQISLKRRLDCKRKFRIWDWPLEANTIIRVNNKNDIVYEKRKSHAPAASPERITDIPLPKSQPFSSKKHVPLLGGYKKMLNDKKHDDRPRIEALPTSYTDLYAEISVLCPDAERTTALCLVCGEMLNSNGRGECTKHALRCGAGCGIFFLLQECRGLIMHGHRSAYIHSPYVDSHGETPQYRGRPLNLDLNRYEKLREMWVGHLVRETVITKRVSKTDSEISKSSS